MPVHTPLDSSLITTRFKTRAEEHRFRKEQQKNKTTYTLTGEQLAAYRQQAFDDANKLLQEKVAEINKLAAQQVEGIKTEADRQVKEISEDYERQVHEIKTDMIHTTIGCVYSALCITLSDKLGFGKTRIQRIIDSMENHLDCIIHGDVTIQELIREKERLMKESKHPVQHIPDEVKKKLQGMKK